MTPGGPEYWGALGTRSQERAGEAKTHRQEHPRVSCQAEGSRTGTGEKGPPRGPRSGWGRCLIGRALPKIPRLVLTLRFMPSPVSTPGALSWVNKATPMASKAV